jgi:carboxyl-terminal processing protease
VEDPSTSALDNTFRLREIDLEKHLINDKQPEEKNNGGSRKPAPSDDTKSPASKDAPAEFGSMNDYQLNQALNLLKGMQILHGK